MSIKAQVQWVSKISPFSILRKSASKPAVKSNRAEMSSTSGVSSIASFGNVASEQKLVETEEFP